MRDALIDGQVDGRPPPPPGTDTAVGGSLNRRPHQGKEVAFEASRTMPLVNRGLARITPKRNDTSPELLPLPNAFRVNLV